jgi:hypothetical protein
MNRIILERTETNITQISAQMNPTYILLRIFKDHFSQITKQIHSLTIVNQILRILK